MDGYSYATTGPDGKPVEHSVPGVERGIVAVITNHSWLDNPTFRGMRQSLMRTFNQIYVLDLHGNAKKKETAPDGSKDENVFDIEQGVAISVFVKSPELEQGIWRGDIWGRQLKKYKALANGALQRHGLEAIAPNTPHYLFHAQDAEVRDLYERGISIPEIMPRSSVGVVTGRDRLAIAFSATEIRDRVADFVERDPENARQFYSLRKDVHDWRVAWAQDDVRNGGQVIKIHYRPFDTRFTFYTGRSRGFHVRPRDEISRHLLRPNLALVTSRLTKGENFRHAQVIDKPTEVICMSPNTSNNGFVFPLRIDDGVENFTPEFREYIDSRYDHHYTPEEILGYIYAVLHAPAYRERYAEFLRIDFPRIPFPEAAEEFERLSALGWGLVQAHLEREFPRAGLGAYAGRGSHEVERVRYSAEEESVWINADQRFENVPSEIWEFYIGGYQVIDKYLKSRKGRTLSLDEINHVGAIADILAFTIGRMAEIDEAYGEAFPDA